MQIYYCDACGLRVNNSELVPGGDKVYCPACAQKQPAPPPPVAAGAQRRTPSGGVVLPHLNPTPNAQRPKTDGYAIPTPLRGHAATQQPPPPAFGSGQHRAHGNTAQNFGSGERPRTGHTGAIPRPASASARNTTPPRKDQTLLHVGGAAVALLILVLAAFAMKSKPTETAGTKPDTKPTPPSGPSTSTTPSTNTKTTPPLVTPPLTPPTTTTQTQPPSTKTDTGMDDIRERAAKREFDAAVKQSREAGDILAARRPLADFLRRYRSTQYGKEAQALLDKLAKADGRNPDTPASTVPGLKAESYERPGDWDEIRNRDLRSLKKIKDVTLDKIDLPNKSDLERVFGRAEFVGVVINGFIEVPADGEYTLGLSSDDASFLWVGDWMVVDHDGGHAASERNDAVPLKKGKHRIRIHYSQGHGDGALQFLWSGPGIGKQIVPPNVLSHTP